MQNNLYKDGSPDTKGVRRSCFKKYCEDLRAESLLALAQVTPSKEFQDSTVPAKPQHNPLGGNPQSMVKSYYNFNEGILLEHSLTGINGSDSSHKGGSSAKRYMTRNYHDPYL